MKESDILVAINQALQGVDKKVLKAGPKILEIRVMSKDRAGLQSKITGMLKKSGVKYENKIIKSKSSFPVTVVQTKDTSVRMIYKTAGGGSGAGAALTKLSESAQALYAAMAFNAVGRPLKNTDLTLDNFNKASSTAITDAKFDDMVNKLPDDWVESCLKGANALYSKYSGNFEFHRGSKKVDIIESAFKKINKTEKAFGDLNKWSPADIYMIKKGFDPSPLLKERSLAGLNALMWQYMKEDKVIGVSLKKITGSAKLTAKNLPTNKKEVSASWLGSTTNEDAMDGYIKWGKGTTEKIQFRSFGGETSLTGWQGEIKGASANQGKISHGPINFILKSNGLKQMIPANQSASLATINSEKHARDIAKLMAEYGIIKPQQVDDYVLVVQAKSNKWRYSKYLVLQLLTTLEKANAATKNDVVRDMYLYSSSQSKSSAPYMKME